MALSGPLSQFFCARPTARYLAKRLAGCELLRLLFKRALGRAACLERS